MLGVLKLQAKMAVVNRSCEGGFDGDNFPLNLRLNNRKLFLSLSVRHQQSQLPDSSHHFTSSVCTSSPSPAVTQLTQWTFTHRHIRILYFIACAAFKRAAESMEKLMDVTREELPDTMAAVRLSGMEISDLTMELSDLGQEITQGVRSSTRAVRLAEERLQRLTNMTPSGGSSNGDQRIKTSSS